MKFILGKKISMSQRFKDNGMVVPVTEIQAGPCAVSLIRAKEKDGYTAVQLGFEDRFREFRLENAPELKRGDKLTVENFEIGDKVQVAGISKGRGFAGVVKRHHFRGSPASHGHKDQLRMPGSIGATDPQHVFKGTRMAGRMGGKRATVKNLEVIEVDPTKNILVVKGAVPGARGSLLIIRAENKNIKT